MYNFEQHPEFYIQAILLTEEEKKEPLSVVREFFGDVELIEVRMKVHSS